MSGVGNINMTGKELTEKVRDGVLQSTSEGGFKYKKAPMSVFSKLDSLESGLEKLKGFVGTYSSMKDEITKLKSYSRVTSWTELLIEIPKALKNLNYNDPNSLTLIAPWLSDYESVSTEDGLREALGDLENIICEKFNVSDMERITSKLNSLFQEFHDAGGEFFVIHNRSNVKELPFSQTETYPHVIPDEPVVTQRTYSRRSVPTPNGSTSSFASGTQTKGRESYGSFLKRMSGRKG